MEKKNPVFGFKETRLNLACPRKGSSVNIRLPAEGTLSSSRVLRKKYEIAEVPIAEDEKHFRLRQLATSSSIYYRKHHKSPRSILWRILEDGKVLALRVVDISKQPDAVEANLTLRFIFPSAIRSSCVALADPKEHDVLNVFVLLESGLCTLTLRPDDFRRPASTESRIDDLSRSYASTQFFRHALQMVALSADELLIALHDGGLLKLEKKSGGDGMLLLQATRTN